MNEAEIYSSYGKPALIILFGKHDNNFQIACHWHLSWNAGITKYDVEADISVGSWEVIFPFELVLHIDSH